MVSRPVVLVNAVKSLPPSVKVGGTVAPKMVSRAAFSKISLILATTVPKRVAPAVQYWFCFVRGEVP